MARRDSLPTASAAPLNAKGLYNVLVLHLAQGICYKKPNTSWDQALAISTLALDITVNFQDFNEDSATFDDALAWAINFLTPPMVVGSHILPPPEPYFPDASPAENAAIHLRTRGTDEAKVADFTNMSVRLLRQLMKAYNDHIDKKFPTQQ